jgi:L,D-transpeptidase YcbB
MVPPARILAERQDGRLAGISGTAFALSSPMLKSTQLRIAVGCLASGLTLAGCTRANTGLPQALQASLDAGKPPAFIASGDEGARLWKDVQRFYKRRAYQPVWIGEPSRGEALSAEIAKAPAEGLDARDYDLADSAAIAQKKPARSWLGKADPQAYQQQAAAELRLSYAFLRYARHLVAGSVDPRTLDKNWVGETRSAELPDVLEQALQGGNLGATLQGLRPRHPQYALLQQALASYRTRSSGGATTSLPGGGQLKNAAAGPAVDTGDVQQRIRTLELNLERWRWLPEELGKRFVMVNIPAFRLQALEDGKPALEMRVITGTTEDPTPILADQMTHVIFSPYWNIPPTIAREEWMPKLAQNPYYLAQNGVEVVKGSRVVDPMHIDWNDPDLRLRQRPGAKNALGFVKFAFPNRYNVYLHDTPNDSAFHRAARDLSHGCVRVEKPLELAEWVLKGQSEWPREKIDAAMHAGTEKHVKLEQPIPVYLIYQTAWVDEGGRLQFLDDLYGHDAAQLRLLNDGPA